MVIAAGVGSDQSVVHESVGFFDLIEDFAAVGEVAEAGEGARGDEGCDGEGLLREPVGDELGMELVEVFERRAFLEERVESLVGERFEFW